MKLIQVLGTGCPKCKKLEENAKLAAEQIGLECEILKVTDINAIVQMGVRNLIEQNPGWSVTVFEDADIDAYLEDMLVDEQWAIIKDEHLGAKSDLWRLLKIYFDGGCYMDIDRLVNIPMDEIVTEGVEWVLPMDLNPQETEAMCQSARVLKTTSAQLKLE